MPTDSKTRHPIIERKFPKLWQYCYLLHQSIYTFIG